MALSSPTSLDRYRPVVYVVTGIAAAFAVAYIHNHYFAGPPDRSLRRRNAIRRRNTRRRGGISLPSGESQINSAAALHALDILERQNRSYGTFRIEMDDGRTVECPLIPSQLISVQRLQQEIGASVEHAIMMRAIMEEAFLDNFLAVELRSPQHIRQGTLASLRTSFLERGISEQSIDAAFERFNNNPNFGENLRRRIQSGEGITLSIQGNTISEETPTGQPQDNGTAEPAADDGQSLFSWREGSDDASPTREGQSLLNLLYHIAEDQARKDGYIHRGVTCNSCGTMPIQGIRYRCANCIDYDLCETCEALQVHIKTHLFYKVRIPAPFLGNPRQSQPVWYPGKPMMMPRNLPRPLAKRLMKETNFENTELDALWDQFRCLASVEWPDDPNNINMAIDRKTFDRCFVPNTSVHPPPPSLIYDRMFAFYDTNGDNLIGFEEFLKGLASFNNKSLHERLRRIFNGYDMDGDGYVERKDFLRIFRAYYTLSRELTRDMVAGMEDDFLEGSSRDVVLGSQPISAAFPGNIPSGEISRTGEGKRTNLHGDMEIIDNGGVLREDGDDRFDRHVVVGEAAVREEYGRSRPALVERVHRPGSPSRQQHPHLRPYSRHGDTDSSDDDLLLSSTDSSEFEEWPPSEYVLPQDIVNALGAYVPLSEVTDPVDRARIGTCLLERYQAEDTERVERVRRQGIEERWRRRAFYTDEEEGSRAPPGYQEDNDEDNEKAAENPCIEPGSDSRAQSPRSRSSSKVRFQDDVTDNEYETRSNMSTSSRSIPVGERWGGFEIPEPERDVGKEILYQITQQGLNELLDDLFKVKEDLLMEAYRTRAERKRWAKEIEDFAREHAEQVVWANPLAPNKPESQAEEDYLRLDTEIPRDKPLEELLDEAGYSVIPETPAFEHASRLQSEEDTATYDSDCESADSSLPDPTLPQNRPNDCDLESHRPTLEPFPELTPSEWDLHSEQQQRLLEEVDPTLPQHRPETIEDIPHLNDSLHVHDITSSTTHPSRPNLLGPAPIYESASTSTSSAHPRTSSLPRSSSLRSRSLPLRLRFERRNPTFAPHSPSSSSSPSSSRKEKPILPSPPRPPSPETLARWARLNVVEHEAKVRGGSGAKLNFEEFALLMQGEKGKRLAFVGSWIDMTSF
ncbi:hypothetical protein VTO42DRAFT_5704 [Malbranchea cinnamomea]